MSNSNIATGTSVCLKNDVLKTEIEDRMGFFAMSIRDHFFRTWKEFWLLVYTVYTHTNMIQNRDKIPAMANEL